MEQKGMTGAWLSIPEPERLASSMWSHVWVESTLS